MRRLFQRFTENRDHFRRLKRSRSRRRPLRTEVLETRQLLAGDFFHNQVVPEDVNGDGIVTVVDALAIINAMGRQSQTDGAMFTDVNDDGSRTAADALRVINRIGRDRSRPDAPSGPAGPLNPPNPAPEGTVDSQTPPDGDGSVAPVNNDLFRSIDGTGNNIDNPDLGSTDEPLLRVAEEDYADGVSAPAGEDRPGTREISNVLSAADPAGTTSNRDLSAFVYVWGQFLDHDIDLSLQQQDEATAESFDIAIPAGDPLFDPAGTGEATIPLTRSAFDPETGTSVDNPRQQVNAITAWIDGSQVYGSDQETADSLREFVGGRLLISENGLLPTDDEGNLLAGDIRAAENIALTAMHALFVREHNRLAAAIATSNPELADEVIYQQARAAVIGEIQSITYNEYLPALLGKRAISEYQGYDPTVDPSIANEFSTAAFRFGHSTLNEDVEFFGNDGTAVADGVSLAEAFFNPQLLEETGIDTVLKFDASTLAQEVDLEVVDSLRNFLFGQPGAGGLDLVALNIQRGRDHGLADYNSTREAYGLDRYESFAQLTSDVQVQQQLESLYGDINHIDLWVGLMAEDHTRGSSVGELTGTIIADQFERLRDGDRFWYEHSFSGDDLRQLQNTTLADVIERNTGVEGLQDNVFLFRASVGGSVTSVGPELSEGATATGQRRGKRGGARADNAMVGLTMELVDDAGNLVDTAVTDRRGNYRFNNFDETGEYQVRVAAGQQVEVVGDAAVAILVSSGDVVVRNVDFVVV